MMWGFSGWGVLWMLLWWGAIVLLVVWTVRQFTTTKREQPSAVDILRERYARGEIDDEEYARRRARLEQD